MVVVPAFRSLVVSLAMGVLVASGAGCSITASVDVANTDPAQTDTTTAPASTDSVTPDSVTTQDVEAAVEDGVAADPTPTVVPGHNRDQQSASEQPLMYGSMSDVDFMNGFTYNTGFDFGPGEATVADGFHENGEFGDIDYYWFGVTQVELGDLDGDGSDEAIVATSWNGGGSGFFDSVTAYRLVDGMVTEAGRGLFGDRADGGIYDVRIEDGVAQVWSFSTTLGACCPNEITRNTLIMGDHWLAQADRSVTRTWMSLNSYQDVDELKFLPGTSSAVLAIYGSDTEGTFTFEAGQGQLLTFELTDGPAPAGISVTNLATGEILSGLAEMLLPSDAVYEVGVVFEAQRDETTTIDVIIDDGEPEPPVIWVPTVEQVVVTNEPFVRTSLVWPVFASEQPGANAANEALADYVTALDDDWVEDVTEFSDPLDDSSYEIAYDVTLATAEIVSVRFDYYDYVCCRPYPDYGQRAVVLDLAAGRLIPVDEILDLSRIEAINELWITELEKQDLLPATVAAVLSEQPRFDSFTLFPGGVEFGTDRNSLGGGMPGTRTFVTFDQLGALVAPALLARLMTS
jgi:hypothetical protein